MAEDYSAATGRSGVVDHDSPWAQMREVVEERTPLSAILEAEPEEKEASAAVVIRAAERIAERVADLMARAHGVEIDEEILAGFLRKEIDGELHEVRVSTLRAFLRYLWQGARNPWEALKNLLAATRLIAKTLLSERGIKQCEVAWILGETKAATRAREKKKVEDYLKSWGAKSPHFEGAQKSEAARATYARVQKGNRNRSKGKSKPRRIR